MQLSSRLQPIRTSRKATLPFVVRGFALLALRRLHQDCSYNSFSVWPPLLDAGQVLKSDYPTDPMGMQVKISVPLGTRSLQRSFCRRRIDQRLTDTIAKRQSQKGWDEPTITSSQRALAAGHGRRRSVAVRPAKMKSGGTPGEIFAFALPGVLSTGL